jgi:23S rRNA G2069 N7-methylase RlmK/C1962 C5-methylase RlmI
MNYFYKDKNWLVVEKPSGISTHGAHKGDLGLVEWLKLHHDEYAHVCSRLDKGTSGLLLFARNAASVAMAQTIHEEERARKIYFFLAERSAKSLWTCTHPLDGKPCQTRFKKIQEGSAYCLYKATLHRGRKHQVRRHAAVSGIPLLGDEEYGGDSFCRVSLHCSELHWPGIDQALKIAFPLWFEACLNGISPEVTGLALAEKRYPFLAAVSDCCRLIHRGEYPFEDMAIDKYGEWLCVTGFDESLPAKQLLRRVNVLLASLSSLCSVRGGVVKTNVRDPHKRKLFADIAGWGEKAPESFFASEHDLLFDVRLNDRQHVGLFLDHRDSRNRIARIAKGKRVANLFAFTCSFSVYALAAGAEVVFSIDLAAGCLNRGRENVAVNQLAEAGNAKFIKEDVRKWLARQLRKKQKDSGSYLLFDLVICDPPVFASAGRGKSFHVEKEWPDLVRHISEIVAPGGVALFSNNHQAGSESFYYDTLCTHFPQVIRMNSALDFPQVPGYPSHVRIYWCVK